MVFTYNHLILTEIRGHGFTASNNHFDGVSYDTSLRLCSNCVGNGSCQGTRSVNAQVAISNNVFTANLPARPYDSVIAVDREFGPLSVAANYFTNGAFPTDFDAWNGLPSTGCSDALGLYGGPLTLAPVLTTRPVTGPR